jgi:hypothetical protein
VEALAAGTEVGLAALRGRVEEEVREQEAGGGGLRALTSDALAALQVEDERRLPV